MLVLLLVGGVIISLALQNIVWGVSQPFIGARRPLRRAPRRRGAGVPGFSRR